MRAWFALHTPCCQHSRTEGFPDALTRYTSSRCMLLREHHGRHFNDDEYWD